MVRRKRLNVTRRQGRIYFRRETKKYSDGAPWGDPGGETLWIMSSDKKPRKVSYANAWGDGRVSFSLGTYRIANPVVAAKMIRQYLFEQV